ncbi:hypothetical protein N9W66_11000 [Luminiphilus sp.]|nr:hypothetical protein [Luminiphilus sp.]
MFANLVWGILDRPATLPRGLTVVAFFSFTVGCGVGSYGEDPADPTSAVTTEEQLGVELSGQTKYLAGETVALTYQISGSASSDATVVYEGPAELDHVLQDKTISGVLPAGGPYTVKINVTSGSLSAEDEVQVYSDANYTGRYVGGDGSSVTLTMGRSSVSEVDENNFVLTRTGKLYWFAQSMDETAFINLLCTAEVIVQGATGDGSGYCKELVNEEVNAYEISSVEISSEATGEIGISYLSDGTTEPVSFAFTSSGEAYVSTDTDITGVYRSQLLSDLNYLVVQPTTLSGDSYDLSLSRCNVVANLSPYDYGDEVDSANVDGSVIPVSDLIIDNCDLSQQSGYAVSVGVADGSDQQGLIQIFESGVSNNVLRFDLYSERGLEFEDPLSKLRYERICFDDTVTSIGTGILEDSDCQELMEGGP